MPNATFTPDSDQDEQLNPGQQDYNRRFGSNDLSAAEKEGTVDKNVNPGEETGQGNGWKNNVTDDKASKKSGTAWFKKKGPLLGIGGGLGVTGILLSGFMAPSMLFPNLMQTSVVQNDSRGAILERRLVKAIDQKMANKNTTCSAAPIKCNMGRMPKSMLSAMEKKGIVAYNADGSKVSARGNGYVNSNPAQYQFTGADGKITTVDASKFSSEYKNNPEFRKALKGAYNMRYLGYNGAYMLKNFFSALGINRNGGMAADAELTEQNAGEKLDNKLKTETDSDKESGAKKKFRDRFRLFSTRGAKRVSKSGGDPVLLVGTVGCVFIKAPRFIAGTYRAIQAAQVIALVNDLILSPGGMQQAGKADGTKVAALGNLLTERVKGSDGALGKSALDSKVLQSAIGVNKNKPGVTRFAPGYGLVSNPAIQLMSGIDDSTEETCDLINSPQAAVASAGVTAAAGAATAGVGAAVILALKAIGKVVIALGAVEFVLGELERHGAIDAVADTMYDLAEDSIGNYVDGARGEDLGDALGVGIFAYFSRAGSAGGAAVLKTDQVMAFNDVMVAVDNEYREEAIATLSPFDVSSPYTFLGSIVSGLSLHSVQDNPLQSTLSVIGHVAKAPFSNLTTSASAQSAAVDNCGYAEEFGIKEGIAVNPAGYPCVGIPAEYLDMSRDTVFSLIEDYIDPETGEPLENKDLELMMMDCSEGDLESIAGCTIEGTSDTQLNSRFECEGEDADVTCTTVTEDIDIKVTGTPEEVRAAMSLYLFDLQVENMLNGSDEEAPETSTAPKPPQEIGTPDNVIPRGKGWTLKGNTDYSAVSCATGTTDKGTYTHPTEGFTFRKCELGGVQVNSLVSETVVSMLTAAKKDGTTLLMGNSFRSYEQQVALRARNCTPSGVCNPPTAAPGNSQHERGLAIDFSQCSAQSTACFRWLKDNAEAYGYYNLPSEPWHWSVSGN